MGVPQQRRPWPLVEGGWPAPTHLPHTPANTASPACCCAAAGGREGGEGGARPLEDVHQDLWPSGAWQWRIRVAQQSMAVEEPEKHCSGGVKRREAELG